MGPGPIGPGPIGLGPWAHGPGPIGPRARARPHGGRTVGGPEQCPNIRFYGSAQVYKMTNFGILGTFGVAVARHGLILWENDATRSTNLFK